MDKFVIEGGRRLQGRVRVNGSKNDALPLLAAALLAEGRTRLRGVPHLSDIATMLRILRELGAHVEHRADGDVTVKVTDESRVEASYENVSTMRASVCVLGPLLARRGKAKVSLPGGCVIGVRPIDLHLKGFAALGAEIRTEHGYVVAEAKKGLRGAEIYLGGPYGSTVTGTANVLMAATLAKGTTVIESAACEPEVEDLARLLIAMGAKIEGAGTHRLVVTGVERLQAVEHTVIPDRIEAGTFLAAGAVTRGNLLVENARMEHLTAAVHALRQIGVTVERENGGIRVAGPERFRPVDLTTLPYPGFATDLQAQFMTLLACADGISVVTEKIYPDRFMHVAELNRMGAQVRKEGASAIIHGVPQLHGAPVMASDLRASAALVIAGLAAKGTTEIRRVYHIDRGYERIEERLNACGAAVKRMVDKVLLVR